ncbi:hypothetical protein GCM10007972_24490 [Iodidimonas muriae]|uniref:Uncharacterized protein n=1 Tax=Iodidimonas muriae TaxID=261467 RepID=A0ABQ2LFR8_9PROT|nr:hypothetical protein [Iodidimonas muriae]GER08844.1 hypothetical protein JCM17843_31540 [Kordiimonadales bacterium JCM 17843]GGO15908.1 hypothetical protein GCM10007972_24490 [Iodidimonas muriae]
MTQSTAVSELRKRQYALEALPDTVTVPAQAPRRPETVAKPIEDATLDDIAFALRGIEAEFNAVGDRLHALRKLYQLARDAGALGTDRAVAAVGAGDA